jgi:SAM-dependent methyltransferase
MPHTAAYVTDVPYVRAFQHEMAPAWLDCIATVCGVEPPPRNAGFAWCDLGCGQGLTATVLAATHAAGRFVGVDLMPAHIANARGLAADAGVGNVEFHNADFAAVDLGDARFDYIVAHGVYAWIDDASQAAVRALIDRHLAPGGLVYVSYNAMPGWAADTPLQRILLALAASMPGNSIARFTAATALARRIAAAGAPSLVASPLNTRLDSIAERHARAYLAHEYLAPHWQPLFVTEVRTAMAGIGLAPVGHARFVDNFDSFVLRAAEREVLALIEDDDTRELVRDFLIHKQFRRDVFSRDAVALDDEDRRGRLLGVRYALIQAPETASFAMRTPAGELKYDNPAAHRIVEGLASGPRLLSQMAAGVACPDDLIASLLALCCGGAVRPVASHDAPVARLNHQIFRRLEASDANGFVVLPCGTAIKADASLLHALRDDCRPDNTSHAASFDFLRDAVDRNTSWARG